MKPHGKLKAPEIWNDERVVYAGIASYRGRGVGSHSYVTLKCTNSEPVNLTKTLSASEAAVLKRSDPTFPWGEGDTTSRLRDDTEAAQVAQAQWREHFPHARVLIKGYHYTAEPQPVLAGLTEVQTRCLNGIYEECERLGWWDGGNDKEVHILSRTWEHYLKEYLEEQCSNS